MPILLSRFNDFTGYDMNSRGTPKLRPGLIFGNTVYYIGSDTRKIHNIIILFTIYIVHSNEQTRGFQLREQHFMAKDKNVKFQMKQIIRYNFPPYISYGQ